MYKKEKELRIVLKKVGEIPEIRAGCKSNSGTNACLHLHSNIPAN